MSNDCLLLRKDVRGFLPAVQWPQGVTLKPLGDALLQPVHALLSQGYAEGQGSVEPLAQWQHALEHDAEYDPQLCFIALRDERVVGVAQAWTSAYLKDLVVCHDQQGQGIGSALLSHVFTVFKQRGEAWVDLKVVEHNLRARRLYEQHGMTLIQRLPLQGM